MGIAVKAVQRNFGKISTALSSIGGLKNGRVIPNPNLGNYGTDYKLRAGITFVGFGTNLPQDGYYPLLVQDSKGTLLDGREEIRDHLCQRLSAPAGAFWSVTNYQDHFLIPKTTKFSINNRLRISSRSNANLGRINPGMNLHCT